MERAEVDRRQSVGAGVTYDVAAVRRGTPACLRKAHSAQGPIACPGTPCALSREASELPQYLRHRLFITSSDLEDDSCRRPLHHLQTV